MDKTTMKMAKAKSLDEGSVSSAPAINGMVKRSATMSIPPNQAHRQAKFPTSPQFILGEEIFHFGHPQHPIAKIDLPDQYTCSGCKESGAGKRFVCTQCDFQLHEFCALVPQALKSHPFHIQHQLFFYSKPVKGGFMKSKCDICGKPTKGYTFRCSACHLQMHPCCAMLSPQLNFSSLHPHTLKLLPTTHSSSSSANLDPHGFVCGECKRKRSGRVYRCTVCDYHLHAVCAKDMVNGLRDNGFHKGRDKNTVFGTAARFASQLMIDFVGGFVDGIAEGVGETLVESVAKGNNGGVVGRRRAA